MEHPTIIFDGECALCNRLIAWLLRADRHGIFAITGGNGPVGQKLIKQAGLEADIADRSVVLIQDGVGFIKSEAVWRVLAQLPFPVSLLSLIKWIPRPIRNRVYEYTAEHRRKLKNADKTCGVPPETLRQRWMERVITDESALSKEITFSFYFNRIYWPVLFLIGVRKSRAFVRLDESVLLARFGHFWVKTPLENICGVQQTGPYKWWRAIGPRESFVDHGLTFGSNCQAGVCICFKTKVAGLGPFKRHSGLTVTVEDVEGLMNEIRRRVGIPG